MEDLLEKRIHSILDDTGATDYKLYITEGPTFRDRIATKKPYKGTRKDAKPWHYKNLSVYMRDVLHAEVVNTGIEADDALAIEHLSPDSETVLCSRDKDLRQVPGMFYSWELGHQAQFGPTMIDKVGSLNLSENRKKLTGTGFAFFCSQVLTGDVVDNIPGLPNCGPVAAYEMLQAEEDYGLMPEWEQLEALYSLTEMMYQEKYPDNWEEELLEQARLCWMVRRLHNDGSPELWELGQTE